MCILASPLLPVPLLPALCFPLNTPVLWLAKPRVGISIGLRGKAEDAAPRIFQVLAFYDVPVRLTGAEVSRLSRAPFFRSRRIL